MRALTTINLVLWMVLCVASIPYTAVAGPSDPVSVEVRTILALTALLMGLLALVRIRRGRPVLG